MNDFQISTPLVAALSIAAVGFFLTVLAQSSIGRAVLARFTQQPLTAFTDKELHNAFVTAPELKARYTARGTMSRYEYERALKVSLKRIRAELARRKAL